MSPEYAMHGQFSVKSDVFSFGILVLEIVSGKKNTDLYQSKHLDDLLSLVSTDKFFFDSTSTKLIASILSYTLFHWVRKLYIPSLSTNISLRQAWKHWTEQTPMEFLDPTLRGSYSRNEVNRCIHIGLLCVQESPSDRPSMATIALMLNSYSVTMSMPRQPASFLRGRSPNRLNPALDSDQSTTSSIPWSVNEVSITELYPR